MDITKEPEYAVILKSEFATQIAANAAAPPGPK